MIGQEFAGLDMLDLLAFGCRSVAVNCLNFYLLDVRTFLKWNIGIALTYTNLFFRTKSEVPL